MKKIVYLGSKGIGRECFSLLCEIIRDRCYEVAAVGCSPRGNQLRDYAIENGFKVFFEPEDIPKCDIIISVQYHAILKKDQIARSELAINLHIAPLPEYRGCNQFSFAILNEDKEFGVTIHELDESIDGGDIYFEERFPIPEGIWVADLHRM